MMIKEYGVPLYYVTLPVIEYLVERYLSGGPYMVYPSSSISMRWEDYPNITKHVKKLSSSRKQQLSKK